MKTFYVIVQEPRVRTTTVTRCIVVAETGEKAIELVKNYYPTSMLGWKQHATFKIECEIPANSVKLI